ncbi:MAG: gamma-glutamyltransferase family protein [Steroidobacteraceae bacterium]
MTRHLPLPRLLVMLLASVSAVLAAAGATVSVAQEKTEKPPLHGRHWMAITGKPLGATAGAKIFERGGNAVDAACAMIAATATQWDTLHWGGETQALIWHPGLKKVIAINALGVAPTGATPEFFRSKGMDYPPEHGPLAAVTPGTPGGILVMLAEYGRLSLAEVLSPAIEMADGFAIEAQLANAFEREKKKLKEWPNSARILLPHRNEKGEGREAPRAGEIFVQAELAATLRKLVDAEKRALARGATRKQAIMAAYERFYRGDIAADFVAGVKAEGGLITREDLANWRVKIEEPRHTNYRGVDVYKLDTWVQGPVMLQALNILENFDLQAMGYNSSRYLHTLYQAMNLSFADRDFYYGDPAFPPREPIEGLLSKAYAKQRASLIGDRNDPSIGPGDPYPFQGETNPYAALLQERTEAGTSKSADGKREKPREPNRPFSPGGVAPPSAMERSVSPALDPDAPFWRGTTSMVSADAEGWLVAVTPSGGWNPAVIAGKTGIGLSQRLQSFVLDAKDNPFNVLEPGKRPRATLTPSLAVRDGKPWLAFAVQGGDSQDQNLLQFFLNVVDFGMTPQVAAEAANMNSFQLRDSFGDHAISPGRMLLDDEVPRWVRRDLISRGYKLEFSPRTSGPITAIEVDRQHGSFWGGVSNHGEDHGIAW